MLLAYKFSKKNSQTSYLDPLSCIKHPRVVTEICSEGNFANPLNQQRNFSLTSTSPAKTVTPPLKLSPT